MNSVLIIRQWHHLSDDRRKGIYRERIGRWK
jgi:hypothetical protein